MYSVDNLCSYRKVCTCKLGKLNILYDFSLHVFDNKPFPHGRVHSRGRSTSFIGITLESLIVSQDRTLISSSATKCRRSIAAGACDFRCLGPAITDAKVNIICSVLAQRMFNTINFGFGREVWYDWRLG